MCRRRAHTLEQHTKLVIVNYALKKKHSGQLIYLPFSAFHILSQQKFTKY